MRCAVCNQPTGEDHHCYGCGATRGSFVFNTLADDEVTPCDAACSTYVNEDRPDAGHHAPRCPNREPEPDPLARPHAHHYILQCTACETILGSCGCGDPNKTWFDVAEQHCEDA